MVCFCKAGCGIQGEGTYTFSAVWTIWPYEDTQSCKPGTDCRETCDKAGEIAEVNLFLLGGFQ